uniref:Uncharacterized protein n=1 Tax=Anguilla anguilla TaxID=7936 RepID=A0A0E9V6A2_ANGAN
MEFIVRAQAYNVTAMESGFLITGAGVTAAANPPTKTGSWYDGTEDCNSIQCNVEVTSLHQSSEPQNSEWQR